MRTTALSLLFLSLAGMVHAQISKTNQYDLVIGTYTSRIKNNGIYVYSFNSLTGEFAYKSKTEKVENPAFLAVSADKKNIYAISEMGEGKGAVNAYSFDVVSGKLKYLNSSPSGGDGPCYVSVDSQKKFVFVANYGGGSLSAIPINADGSLGTAIQTIQHEGSSVNKARQEKPHVHSAVLSPDSKYLVTPDLGTDKVHVYSVDVTKPQPLSPAATPFVAATGGTGPRHFEFLPGGKMAFVVLELEASVTAFDFKDGKLEPKQSITMVADGFKKPVSAADIHASPDGKFLYASNRGEADEIVIYSVDKNGKLAFAGRQPVLGLTPRNFAIDPSGNFLLAACQNSDGVTVFRRDLKTGLLTPTGGKILVGAPVCLKFVSVD